MRNWWGNRSRAVRASWVAGSAGLAFGSGLLLWWAIAESWRLGAYPVVTEFVVPFFVGVGTLGTAVVAVGTSFRSIRASERANAIAERATRHAEEVAAAEVERLEHAERTELARKVMPWINSEVEELLADRSSSGPEVEEARLAVRQDIALVRSASPVMDLIEALSVHSLTIEIKVMAITRTAERVWGPPLTDDERDDINNLKVPFLVSAREAREALLAWQSDASAGAEKIRMAWASIYARMPE